MSREHFVGGASCSFNFFYKIQAAKQRNGAEMAIRSVAMVGGFVRLRWICEVEEKQPIHPIPNKMRLSFSRSACGSCA